MNLFYLALVKQRARVKNRCLDIFFLKLGKSPNNIVPGISDGDLVQNNRNRDSGTLDYGFAVAHSRIEFNAFKKRHNKTPIVGFLTIKIRLNGEVKTKKTLAKP